MEKTIFPVTSKGVATEWPRPTPSTRGWRSLSLRTICTALMFSAATFTVVYHDSIYNSIIPSWSSQIPFINAPTTDWSSFAYVQSVATEADVCGSLMLFESLSRLGSKADRVLLYPSEWDSQFEFETSSKMQMLIAARDKYNVKLQASDKQGRRRKTINNQHQSIIDISGAVAKIVQMRWTQYQRVIVLDTAGTILQSLDELFFLPSAPIAMPSAYWAADAYSKDKMSAAITVVQPALLDESTVYDAVLPKEQDEVNTPVFEVAYGTKCMAFTHRPYIFPTEELNRGVNNHKDFLEGGEEWDANKVMGESKYIYFSDPSVPRPWFERDSTEDLELNKSTCYGGRFGSKECRDKEVLRWLYKEYAARRKDVCRLELL